MNPGSITNHIDFAQVAITVFFLLFLVLVWYLRREDKREGYPMRASPFVAAQSLGFPGPPERPEEYQLLEGGSTFAPHHYPMADMKARPLYGFDGTPLVPVGNPLLAGIGPGAYVNRRDEPMLNEKHQLMLQPLRLLPDWAIEAADTDPRGMVVYDWRWREVGVVADIWVDRSIQILRLLDVQVHPGFGIGRVLVPIFHVDIREKRREVRIESLWAHQLADVPMPARPDRITAREDDRLNAYYAAGRFYRESGLTEPPGTPVPEARA